ncbi:MAG: hypothetical protein R3D68_01380 [Hyphomicrobiaceae bacterium]
MAALMPRIVGGLAVLALGGCGAAKLSEQLGALPEAPPAERIDRPQSPIDSYSTIARAALNCWFGPSGSLKRSHVFHAEAPPPDSGKGAEIVIYQRDPTGGAPRALRAFRIVIARSGEGSSIQTESYRMDERVAADMKADVIRWAQGQTACSVVGTGGWGAAPGEAKADAQMKPEAASKAGGKKR